jgi:hypothetical protein
MTEDKIARQAGCALDRLIAEQVMGWVPQEIDYWVDSLDRPSRLRRGQVWYPPGIKPGSKGGWQVEVPPFSTELEAAWQVVEHYAQRSAHASQQEQEQAAAFAAGFQQLALHQFTAPCAAQKICELALLAAERGKGKGDE